MIQFMILATLDMAIDFWMGLTFAVVLVLLMLSPTRGGKVWYLLVLLSLGFWLRTLIFKVDDSLPIWFHAVPFFWIVCTIWLAFPKTQAQPMAFPPSESRLTQEALLGKVGTTEALRVFFTLVWLASATGLLLWSLLGAFRLIALG